MSSSVSLLLVNWKLKLASLALALLLWVAVSGEQTASQWLTVPVQVALRDGTQAVVRGPFPPEVAVRFSGPGRELWKLALNRPTLVLPVGDAEPGDQIRLLSPTMVSKPAGISAEDVRPSSVRLVFEPLASREVPVRLRTTGGSERGLEWTDGPRISPARVRLIGPRGRVLAIDSVATVPFEIRSADPSFRREVRLDTAALGGVRLSSAMVEVTGVVAPLAERILRGVPVQSPPGLAVRPGTADVVLRGSSAAVEAVNPAELRVAPVSDSLPRGTLLADTVVPLTVVGTPPGVEARVFPRTGRIAPFPALLLNRDSATPRDSLPLRSPGPR